LPENEIVILQTSEREKNGYRQFGVSVIDKGIGMTKEQLERVGERFYRADDRFYTWQWIRCVTCERDNIYPWWKC